LHDGSRTPAWDPNVTNTPGRVEESDGYGFDTSYNPATPGYSAAPYTPQTPGGYGSDHSYSPYQPSPSSMVGSTTPYHGSHHTSAAPSPAGGPYTENPSPAASYQPTPSPVGGGYNFSSPMTPSAGYHPQTPGTGKKYVWKFSSDDFWGDLSIIVLVRIRTHWL